MSRSSARAFSAVLGGIARLARPPEEPLALPVVTPAHAAAANRLHVRRKPLALRLLGRAATLAAAFSAAAEAVDSDDRFRICVDVDGSSVDLMIPASLLRIILRETDPALVIDRLAAEEIALVLELALSESLDALEAATQWRLAIRTVAPSAGETMAGVDPAWPLLLDIAGLQQWRCALRLGAVQTARLAHLLDRAAGVERAAADDLRVPACLRIGASRPTIREIESLAPGDVILFDDVHAGAGGIAVFAVFAEHLVAPVTLDATGARLAAPPRCGRGSPWEWTMDKQTEAPAVARIDDAALDDMAVRVTFEIGRTELTLGEIRRLAAGALIPLPRPPDSPVDMIAFGRRIGRGSLVRIGDGLGLRITRLLDHD